MKGPKKIGVLVIIIVVVMQFIQPTKNISDGLGGDDISKVYQLPVNLHQTLINKCYDCHSNNTRYPWYFNIQPIGWWLAAHVHDGKEHLNFSAFKTYKPQRAEHKLEELWEVTEERSMPIRSYTMFHKGSELTDEDEKAIFAWLTSLNIKPD
jgi:hypothetical protein